MTERVKINNEFSLLIKQLEKPFLSNLDVITWGSPIISFGNIHKSKIATIGINPSNREFVDINGVELDGYNRRFYTLNSLNLKQWKEIKSNDFDLINKSCEEYFNINPYDGWFKKLDFIISGSSMSYYFPSNEACHLDLIPYATKTKWSELSRNKQLDLLELTSDFLGILLQNSKIEVVVLNGQTVVDNFKKISSVSLKKEKKDIWNLSRKNNKDVQGYSYSGYIDTINNINLGRKIKVLGYNHNIQSSFGVSLKILKSIRKWITEKV